MSVEEPNTDNIKFREVLFSDLNSVINIYKKKDKKPLAGKSIVDFGLPLSIATDHNEIIGFASAFLNEPDEISVNLFCVRNVDNAFLENGLKQQAEKILCSTFGHFKKDNSSLKNSIDQLVLWLNKCGI